MGTTMEELADSDKLVNFADISNNIQWGYEYLVAKMNEISQDNRWDIYWIDI
jgi:hypothetical protein